MDGGSVDKFFRLYAGTRDEAAVGAAIAGERGGWRTVFEFVDASSV